MSEDRFARQNPFRPPSTFLSTSSCTRKDHHLSGPEQTAETHNFTHIAFNTVHVASLAAITCITFIALRVLLFVVLLYSPSIQTPQFVFQDESITCIARFVETLVGQHPNSTGVPQRSHILTQYDALCQAVYIVALGPTTRGAGSNDMFFLDRDRVARHAQTSISSI